MPLYASKPLTARFKAGFRAAGKKLEMGKACVHFKKAEDLALDMVGGDPGRDSDGSLDRHRAGGSTTMSTSADSNVRSRRLTRSA
jgi:hypothetical protein